MTTRRLFFYTAMGCVTSRLPGLYFDQLRVYLLVGNPVNVSAILLLVLPFRNSHTGKIPFSNCPRHALRENMLLGHFCKNSWEHNQVAISNKNF